MEVILSVHVGKSLQRLEDDVTDDVLREKFAAVFHYFEHVLVEVLKNEMQILLLKDNLIQLHDVRVRQLYQ